MSKKTEKAERLAALQKTQPLPAPTGQVADKAFFDRLCGEKDQQVTGRSSGIPP
jgi:hypothetical protein